MAEELAVTKGTTETRSSQSFKSLDSLRVLRVSVVRILPSVVCPFVASRETFILFVIFLPLFFCP